MKKSSPFMLTRKFDAPAGVEPRGSRLAVAGRAALENRAFVNLVKKSVTSRVLGNMDLTKAVRRIDPRLLRALADSLAADAPPKRQPKGKPRKNAPSAATTVLDKASRRDRALYVGLLDMGTWIGGLPALLERLNAAQSLFVIFEVQAAVPGGLVKTAEGMADWLEKQTGEKVPKRERETLERQMMANEFFRVAEDIRESLGLDLIVGLTAAMIAGVSRRGEVYWNHFSSVRRKSILVSTADIRGFAAEAGRPFEAAVGALLLPTLMIAVNKSLGYHEDTGCLFDYNGSRVSLTAGLRAMTVDHRCLDRMKPRERTATEGMLKALKTMRLKTP